MVILISHFMTCDESLEREKVAQKDESCEICNETNVDDYHYFHHLNYIVIPNCNSSKKSGVELAIDVHALFIKLRIKNLCTESISLNHIILINKIKKTSIPTENDNLDPDEVINIELPLDSFNQNGCNSVITSFDCKLQHLQRFKFYMNMGSVSQSIHEKITEKLKFDLYPLNKYHPSDDIKDLVKYNFEDENFSYHKLQIVNRIKNFSSNDLNTINYKDTLTMLSEIEDCTVEKEMECYDIHSILISAGTNLYKFSITLLKDTTFLSEYQTVRLTPRYKLLCDLKVIYGCVKQITLTHVFIQIRKKLENIEYHIRFLPNRLTIQLERMALDRAKELNIIPLLFPNKYDMGGYLKYQNLNFINKNIENNPEQKEAIYNIVNGTSYPAPYILYGPPGTGKTRTIVESMCQILKTIPESKILVCAPSNSVCDDIALQLLRYIAGVDPDLQMIRLYSPSFENAPIASNLFGISNYGSKVYPKLEIIYKYRIIISTLTVAGRLAQAQINTKHFTHLFIDECGFAMESLALIPIAGVCSSYNKINAHVILSGDPNQLQPITKTMLIEKCGLNFSMLERLMRMDLYKRNTLTNKYNPKVLTKLLLNYRSHDAIIKIPNTMMYEGEMRAVGCKDKIEMAVNFPMLPKKGFPVIFDNIEGITAQDENTNSYFNNAEIDRVINYVRRLLGIKNVKPEDIGIISPYKKQCEKLEKILGSINPKWKDIEISSVDGFQGREKPIIIISTVRSNSTSIGFLTNQKRWNVMLTRAAALLIVIGNASTLMNWNIWKIFIGYVKDNNGFVNTNDKKENNNRRNAKPLTNKTNNLSTNNNKQKRYHQRRAAKKPTEEKIDIHSDRFGNENRWDISSDDENINENIVQHQKQQQQQQYKIINENIILPSSSRSISHQQNNIQRFSTLSQNYVTISPTTTVNRNSISINVMHPPAAPTRSPYDDMLIYLPNLPSSLRSAAKDVPKNKGFLSTIKSALLKPFSFFSKK